MHLGYSDQSTRVRREFNSHGDAEKLHLPTRLLRHGFWKVWWCGGAWLSQGRGLVAGNDRIGQLRSQILDRRPCRAPFSISALENGEDNADTVTVRDAVVRGRMIGHVVVVIWRGRAAHG